VNRGFVGHAPSPHVPKSGWTRRKSRTRDSEVGDASYGNTAILVYPYNKESYK
jgi:hypothetical protein